MPIHRRQNFLLAYDIADPGRLVRVHRTVRRWGVPLQYSVFLVPASPSALDRLLGELARIIEDSQDDIRVYPLPQRLEWIHLGRQVLPDGVELVGSSLAGDALEGLLGCNLDSE